MEIVFYVLFIIITGLIGYLLFLHKRIKDLEKKMQDEKS